MPCSLAYRRRGVEPLDKIRSKTYNNARGRDMEKIKTPDLANALCKVKGYRSKTRSLYGMLGIFFSIIVLATVFGIDSVPPSGRIIACIACGIVVALCVFASVYDRIARSKTENRDCVILYQDGLTVYVDNGKSEREYCYFSFEEIEDYGFIHILEGESGSGEVRLLFRQKSHSAETYLSHRLLNYGFLRITAKDGGYYNVPVGDLATVKQFFREHTKIEEYVYIRIAGIHDQLR